MRISSLYNIIYMFSMAVNTCQDFFQEISDGGDIYNRVKK